MPYEKEPGLLRAILTTTTTNTEMPKESENSHKPKKRKKQRTPKIKLAIDDSTGSEDSQEINMKEKESEMRININESTSSESGIITKEWPSRHPKSSGAVHTIISNLSLPKFWQIVKPMAEMVLSDINTVDENTVLSRLSNSLMCNCFQIWNALKECVITKIKFCDKLADVHGGMLSVHEWLVFDMVLVHLQYYDIIDMNYTAPEDKKIYVDLFKLVQEFKIEDLEGDELAEAWAALTKSYNTKGRQATPMLLQCRWYQLKLATRNRFFKYYSMYKSTANLNEVALYKPSPLQIAIADCYESLLTKPFIFWKELIKQKRVILREQFQLIALRQHAQGVDSSQSLSNTRGMQINIAVEASNNKIVIEPSETVLPKITNVFGNVNVPVATLSKICTLSKMNKNINISTAESEETSNAIFSQNTDIVTVESETTSNANVSMEPVNTEVFIDLTRNDDWSVWDVISHKKIAHPENKSPIYDVGNTNGNVSREQSSINRVANKNPLITNEKSNNLGVTEEFSDFEMAIKSHKLSRDMTNPMPYTRINVCSQLEQPTVAVFKSHEVRLQKNKEGINIKQPSVNNESNGKHNFESLHKQPNNAIKQYEKIDTLKSVNRLKLSSDLLQKPRHLSYNRAQLSNNPDFNRKLKKMSKRFSKSDHNRKFLAVLKPVTVDVSKEFETALVDGKIYLDESEDNNKQEKKLTVQIPILIPENKIGKKIPHIEADAAKSKKQPLRGDLGDLFLSEQKCCWSREKMYRLKRKLSETNLPCHNCPHPICLCCCRDEYFSYISKQNLTELTTKKVSSESEKLKVDNKSQTNSNLLEVFFNNGKISINQCTQTDTENNEIISKIGNSQCPISNKNIPASEDMNIDIEEAINTTFIQKSTEMMLPKITAIFGNVQESSEDPSKINVMPTQINDSNLSKELPNLDDRVLKENLLVTNDSKNTSLSYNDSNIESTNNDLPKESELMKFLKISTTPAKSDNTLSSWKDVNTVPVEVQTGIDETVKTLFNGVKLNNTLHSQQKPDSKECQLRIKLSSHLLQKPTNCTYNGMKLLKNPDFNKDLRKYPNKFLKSYHLNLSLLKPITIDVSKEFEMALVNGRMYLDTTDSTSEGTKDRLKLLLTRKDNNMTSHSSSKKLKQYSKRTSKYKKKFKDKKTLDKTYDVLNKCCWAREKIYRLKKNLSTINDNCPCPSCLCCCRKKYATYISKKTDTSILITNNEPKESAIDTEIIIDDVSENKNSFNTDLNEMSTSNDNNPKTLGFNSDLTEITATHDNNSNALGLNSDITEITSTHDNPNTLDFNCDLIEMTATHDNNPNTLGFNADLTEITATHDNNSDTVVFNSDLTEITATHGNNLLTLDLEVTVDNNDLCLPTINDKVAHDNRSQTTELLSNNSMSVRNNVIFMTTAQIPQNLKPLDVKLLSDKLDSKVSESVAKLTSYEVGDNNNMNGKPNNIFMDWKVSTSVAKYSSEYLLLKLSELPLCPKPPEPFSIEHIDDVMGSLFNKVLTPITSVSEFFYAYLLNGLFFVLDVEKKSVHAINICF